MLLNATVHPVTQLVELWTPGPRFTKCTYSKTGVTYPRIWHYDAIFGSRLLHFWCNHPHFRSSFGWRRRSTPGMAGGLWHGSPKGQVKPVSGVGRVQSLEHVKHWVLNSAGQQESGTAQQVLLSAGSGHGNPSTQNARTKL